MAEKIFVSYSHEDRKYLDGLKEVLQEHGVIEGDEVSIIDPFSGVADLAKGIIKASIRNAVLAPLSFIITKKLARQGTKSVITTRETIR